MRARLRAPGGASTVELADDATVGDLISKIVEKTSLSSFDIKYGYPPKPLLLDRSETLRPLKDLGIKLDGEQLTISHKELPVAPQSSQDGTQGVTSSKGAGQHGSAGPVSLQRKGIEGDVPELPLPDRGATLGRVSNLLCT